MQEVPSLQLKEIALVGDEPRVLPLRPRKRRFFQWCEASFWSVCLFVATQTWVVQGYKVYGSCMEPNFYTGERLLGSKVSVGQGVQRGDVVVFRPPHRPDTIFIKRVVGLPGEVLEIRNNRVFVNDRPIDEPYLHLSWHDDRPPQRIPKEMVYVMGDNRDNSNDSRMWGLLPVRNIQAKAWLRYWPLNRVEWIQ